MRYPLVIASGLLALVAGCPCQHTGADPCGASAVTGAAHVAGFAIPYDIESCVDGDCASATVMSPVSGVLTLANGVEVLVQRPDTGIGVSLTLLSPWGRSPGRRFAWTLTARGATGSASAMRDVDTGATHAGCDRVCVVDQEIDFGTLSAP